MFNPILFFPFCSKHEEIEWIKFASGLLLFLILVLGQLAFYLLALQFGSNLCEICKDVNIHRIRSRLWSYHCCKCFKLGVPRFTRNGANVGMVFEFLLRGHKLGYCLSMSYFKVNEQLHWAPSSGQVTNRTTFSSGAVDCVRMNTGE